MSEEKLTKIKEKINALLALASRNDSKEEAMSALTKARELMIKYNIEDNEIKSNDKKQIIIRKTDISTRLNLKKIIVVRLSKYLRVKVFMDNGKLSLFGYLEDVNMAEIFIKNILNTASKQANKFLKGKTMNTTYKNAVKNDYMLAFIDGIIQLWETQNKQFSNALILTTSIEVNDGYQNFSKKLKTKTTTINTSQNENAIRHGKQAGANFINKNAILNN